MSGSESSEKKADTDLLNKRWANLFEHSLRLGYADPELFKFLDDILRWYTGIERVDRCELYKRLCKEYGEKDFRVRFENFVDRLVVSNLSVDAKQLFGMLDRGDAKWRYRKLISIFHPDKGSNEQDWLNFRAEKINKFYKEVNKPSNSFRDRQTSYSEYYSANTGRKRRIRKNKRYKETNVNNGKQWGFSDWRRYFMDPVRLERRILISILIIFTTFGGLLIISAYI